MKIAIVGAGGLGGYFGARLAAAKEEVAFVARGDHLAAMRDRGLRVTSPLGDIHLQHVVAAEDPSQLGTADIVLVSVKLWDLQAVARQLHPLVGPGTALISFQNGIDKDDVLAREFGREAVMGGVGYISSHIAAPGEIVHSGSMQRLVFGELDASGSPRAERFLAACKRAGIDADISTDIRSLTWQKFVFLVGLSGMTTATRLPIGRVRENRDTRAMLRDLMAETVAVAESAGVRLPPDFAEDRLRFCDGLPFDMTSSMHEDLKHGRRLELPWLSGRVVELATQHGIAAPANRAVQSLLSPHVAGA